MTVDINKKEHIYLVKGVAVKAIIGTFFFYAFFGVLEVQCASDRVLEHVFTKIYESNVLPYAETISGMGASLEHTETIRKELPALFQKYNITSILDIGCGDFNWMRHVISDDITYIGIDVVKKVVEDNNTKYQTKRVHFKHVDASCDSLPQVDLIICRDILPYLPFNYAFKIIENIVQSGSKYVLFTMYANNERVNRNLSQTEIGGNYCLHMQKEPFSLMEPLELLYENCSFVCTPDKSLGLWYIRDLRKEPSAVTYLDEKNWGGRLGDKLLMYVKARWVAYKYELPFFYKPFKYSDQLMMHEKDEQWSSRQAAQYKKIKEPQGSLAEQKNNFNDLDFFINKHASTLYVINYYFQPEVWGRHQAQYDSQCVGEWDDLYNDEAFRTILRSTIKPRFKINEIVLPKDRLTVAVHVRKGGGFDDKILSLQLYGDEKRSTECAKCFCGVHASDYTDFGYALKFPPDQFYVDQIRYLSSLYDDIPMYVHIFTDDQNPQQLVDRYAQAVEKSNISYGCRQVGNHHDANIIDDLFNMTRFDCLIRSGSNFPQVAELIGNYQVVLYPKDVEWRSILNVYNVGEIH